MLNMVLRRVLPAFLLLCLAASAYGADDQARVYRMLKEMGQAMHRLNYEGTFVYLHDNHLESMRIVHRAMEGGKERERLISLNGTPREIVRDDDSIVCILPDLHSVSSGLRSGGRGISETLTNSPEKLSSYYDFKLMADERVAGRRVEVIVIIPKDNFRYGHRLYLDVEHALPLQMELLDEEGVSVSQIMFTDLQVDTGSDGDDDKEGEGLFSGEYFSWIFKKPARRMKQDDDSGPWQFQNLPRGFRMNVHAQRPSTGNEELIDHFVFSDGLATLSVYVEKAEDDQGLIGESRMGAVSVYGLRLDDHQITVVGEVPPQTVRELARGVTRKAETTAQAQQ